MRAKMRKETHTPHTGYPSRIDGKVDASAPILAAINKDIGPDPSYVWLAHIYGSTGRRYIFIAV